jgi:eukaryotic-like serine/threonine-protein kinase
MEFAEKSQLWISSEIHVRQVLGQGGFATVYLADWCAPGDAALSRVAVKVAHEPRDPRMLREAQALRRLGPPVAPALLHEGTTEDARPFLIMELLGTDGLAARIGDPGQSRAPEAVVPLFAAVCQAVAAMHARGVVHRDLKPANILFRAPGQAVLIDLGLALWQAEAADSAIYRTRAGEWTGSPPYMAPEQWEAPGEWGNRVVPDPRTDVYALGVILFEMLTGSLPFTGDVAELRRGHVLGRCPRPSAVAPGAAPLDDVVLRCLAKDRAQRLVSASDLIAAIHGALAPGPAALRAGEIMPAVAPPSTAASPAARPVALLAVSTSAPMPEVTAAMEAHEAVLAGADGHRYVAAFPWAQAPAAGVRAALDAARALAASLGVSGTSVVHLAPLLVRQRRHGTRLGGDALRQRAAWDAYPDLDHVDEHGVLLTQAAAHVLEADLRAPVSPGWFQPRRHRELALVDIDPQGIPLWGRDDSTATLVTEAEACLSTSTPLLSTIQGDIGMGKTRLLYALATALRGRPGYQVAYVRAQPPRQSEADSLLAACFRVVLDIAAEAVSMDALDRAWDALGVSLPSAGRLAVALLFGAIPREAPELAPILGVPGALRQATSRALALALVRSAARAPLMLLVDDVQWADPATLDALELATLGRADAALTTGSVALGVWTATRTSMHEQRPRWGDRAAAYAEHVLAPLDRDAARAVLGALLRPVELIPEPVLDHLHALSSGVPLYLVELARVVRASGAIRSRGGQTGYYIAADEIVDAIDGTVDEALARRALAALPALLMPLAELCAVLGDIDVEVVRGIQAVLEERNPADEVLAVDPGVGLARLVHHGLLVHGQHGHAVRHPVLGKAIEALLPSFRRNELHAAAVAYWQRRGSSNRQRLAHHAARCGANDLAAALHLELARDAHDSHRFVAAETHYTRALEHLLAAEHSSRSTGRLGPDDIDPESKRRRAAALAGRGTMRYRLQRLTEALDDLGRARALAEARGDRAETIALLLEEATVLDWCQQFSQSAARVAEAVTLARDTPVPHLAARIELAEGRSLARSERLEAAVPLLERAIARAGKAGDYEAVVIARLLLGPVLTFLGRFDEATQCFAEAIVMCRQAGDDFHLAGVYLNRQHLWFEHQQFGGVVEDLEVAAELGHQLGNAHFERATNYNLAEFYYWQGDWARAQLQAERSLDLHVRFMSDYLTHHEHHLLARIACSQGSVDARDHVAWIDDHCDEAAMPPSDRVLLALVRLALVALGGEPVARATWEELERRAGAEARPLERMEVVVMAAELLSALGDLEEARHWLARARTLETPLWARRLAALSQVLGA